MKSNLSDSAAERWRAVGHAHGVANDGPAPVLILSYPHPGARRVEQVLADGTDLACTAAAGILPSCEIAAATWAKIDNRPGQDHVAAGDFINSDNDSGH